MIQYEGLRQFRKLAPKIYWIQFQTRVELCASMLRFQEHFEGPNWRNKIFKLSEYIDDQIKTHGRFDYYTRWRGFNIPSKYIEPFKAGKFNPLDDREKLVMLLLKPIEEKEFYLIGTYIEDEWHDETLDHEIAHALFACNPEYKKSVRQIMGGIKPKPIHDRLIEIGYSKNKDILEDETHAYLMEDADYLREKCFPIEKFISTRKKLIKNFQKYKKLMEI